MRCCHPSAGQSDSLAGQGAEPLIPPYKVGLEGEKGQDISQHGKKSGHTA